MNLLKYRLVYYGLASRADNKNGYPNNSDSRLIQKSKYAISSTRQMQQLNCQQSFVPGDLQSYVFQSCVPIYRL